MVALSEYWNLARVRELAVEARMIRTIELVTGSSGSNAGRRKLRIALTEAQRHGDKITG